MNILVVEDEKISRIYLKSIADNYGKCDTAENGETAVEKIKKSFENNEKYDLVFLDIMLPKMTGHKVLEFIREYEENHEINEDEKTFVIMTSALKDRENVKKAYANTADGYMVKPIFKEKIVEILNKAKK